MDLERADQAPRVTPRAIGSHGIDPPEVRVKGLSALVVEALLERRSERRVGRRTAEIPTVEHGAEVESRPSLQHRQMPSPGDYQNRPKRDPLVVGGGEWLVGVDDVDAMSRNTTQFSAGWFVGANVAVAEDLARVHVYQLGVEPVGNADRELGLSARPPPGERHPAP